MTLAETTAPDCEKNSRRLSLVVLKLRLPTNSFCAIEVACQASVLKARLGARKELRDAA